VAAVLLTGWACGTSGPSSGGWSGNKEMDRAVAAFIARDYAEAVERLEALTARADTEEQLREVYWYLGRSHVALEQYDRAIDAFTAGKANGGGVEFDEYLSRLNALISGEQDAVVRSDRVTRAQLAVLIDRMFYRNPFDEAGREQSAGADALLEQLAPVTRGVLVALPDGDFHAEAYVTRASFFATVSRLVRERKIEVDTAVLFEGGFAWALATDEKGDRFVSGKQVVHTLQRLAAAQHTYGG
jgi:tetratricopeptide (TPR) repeat protein